MKRSGFKRPEYVRKPRAPLVLSPNKPEPQVVTAPLRVADQRARLVVPLPKDMPKRSEPYLRWVASLECAHCQRAGPSQAAHADQGKGLAIKACDSTVFPLCADRPGELGCHSLMGASGKLSRAARRALEVKYGANTVARADAEGALPSAWKK